MRAALFIVDDVSFAVGAIIESYRARGDQPVVYSVRSHAFVTRPNLPVPLWAEASGGAPGTSFLVGRFLQQLVRQEDAAVFTIGIAAGVFAARHLGNTPTTAILGRGELDVSWRRPARKEAALETISAAARLVLADAWEMGKATALDSRVPHFRMPAPAAGTATILGQRGSRIAVVRGTGTGADATYERLRRWGARRLIHVAALDPATLYSAADLTAGTPVATALHQQLREFSHLVVLGDGALHTELVRALGADADRVIVEATLGSTSAADELGYPTYRGPALLAALEASVRRWRGQGNRVLDLVHDAAAIAGGRVPIGQRYLRAVTERLDARPRRGAVVTRPTVSGADELPAALARIAAAEVPWFFEELWESSNAAGPIDVLATFTRVMDGAHSVDAVPIRDAARAHRISHAAAALAHGNRSVAVHLVPGIIDRRSRLLAHLIGQGDRIGLVLKERTPTRRRAAEPRVAAFLTDLAAAGGRVVALEDFGEGGPILARGNAINVTALGAGHKGTTFVLRGNLTDAPADEFLTAYADVSATRTDVRLDVVVRAAEAELAAAALTRCGLVEGPRVRLLTEGFDAYLPQTRAAIGVELLDAPAVPVGGVAEPGEAPGVAEPGEPEPVVDEVALAYRVASFLERGLPILCCADLALADVLTQLGAGITCGRSAADIRAGIERAIATDRAVDPFTLLAHHDGPARLAQLRERVSSLHQSA